MAVVDVQDIHRLQLGAEESGGYYAAVEQGSINRVCDFDARKRCYVFGEHAQIFFFVDF